MRKIKRLAITLATVGTALGVTAAPILVTAAPAAPAPIAMHYHAHHTG